MPVTSNPLTLKFYQSATDSFLLYAVIIAKYQDQWVFCKHKKRTTLEIPGGRREKGETIEQTARRELYEETGASIYTLKQLTPYSVIEKGVESFGMLYYAKITSFDDLPESEMEKILLLKELPPIDQWTYPTLQPLMMERYMNNKKAK